MSPWGRAILGAALGGTLALVFHPASRPYFSSAFFDQPRGRLADALPEVSPQLTVPRNLDEAALWIRLGLEKTIRNEPLKSKEKQTLIRLAQQGFSKDGNNAFWLQAEAVFQTRSGNLAQAERLWRQASRINRWDDRQTQLIEKTIASLGPVANQAWPFAVLNMCRNHSAAVAAERLARTRLSGVDLNSRRGADIRIEVIRNGQSIRSGARTILDGTSGAKMVDLAVYPPEFMDVSRPKRLYLGRGQLYETMRAEGREGEISELVGIFHENDAWSTITSQEEAESNLREYSTLAALLTALPGAMLALAFLGAVGMLVGRLNNAGPKIPVWITIMAVASLTGIAWMSSASWLGAGAVAVCGAFVLIRPRYERGVPVDGLGPLFQFVVGMLALMTGITGTLWIAGRSGPAGQVTAVLPTLPDWWIEPASTGALAALFVSLLGLVAPAYALVYRVPTPRVLTLAIRWFGTFLLFGAWSALIIGTPLVVTADRALKERLRMILINEPVYYLTHDH